MSSFIMRSLQRCDWRGRCESGWHIRGWRIICWQRTHWYVLRIEKKALEKMRTEYEKNRK